MWAESGGEFDWARLSLPFGCHDHILRPAYRNVGNSHTPLGPLCHLDGFGSVVYECGLLIKLNSVIVLLCETKRLG